MRLRLVIATIGAVFFVSCAGMTVVKVKEDAKDHGLRFYRNVPYLLVTTNNQGGVTTQVMYLPDTNDLMSAHVYSYGATNETTLKFKDGILTSSSVDVDTGVIPKAILSAVATVAASTFNIAGGQKQTRLAPGPYLYKIKVKGNTAELIGSDDIITINIGTETAK